MQRATPLLLSPVLALLAGQAPCPAFAQSPRADGFTITDQLAPQEVSENTEIYLDGKLVGQLHLDDKTRVRVVPARVADPFDRHSYALCGEITVRKADGGTETHLVDNGGFISDVAGRDFQALGMSDFTFFYLMDQTPGRALPMPVHGRAASCHPPVS